MLIALDMVALAYKARAFGFCPHGRALSAQGLEVEFISWPYPVGDELHILTRRPDDATSMHSLQIDVGLIADLQAPGIDDEALVCPRCPICHGGAVYVIADPLWRSHSECDECGYVWGFA
jgi:hypothetical protein